MSATYKYSNPEMTTVFKRKAGVFQTETKTYKNRSGRKNTKNKLAEYYR
jgi:hypothetical protein